MSEVGATDPEADDRDLTILLQAYAQGDQQALHLFIHRVYAELRSIASGRLQDENRNPLMGPTALVNEAYLRLFGGKAPLVWNNRRHFFAAASETMRRILVDQARQRLAVKRGGGAVEQKVADIAVSWSIPDEELLDLDVVFQEFAEMEPDKAELVKLRFYLGMSENEAAEMLGISRATASRHWTYARSWLYDRLKRRDSNSTQDDVKFLKP